MSEPLLKVEGLKQYFPVSRSYTVKAVNGVSFEIYPGETYGLVGESGSGKTTIGRSIIRLYNPTEGKITFGGREISGRMDAATRAMLRTDMQMIFQDPMASLNPRKKVGDIIGEGLDIHHRAASKADREAQIGEMLRKVGLSPEHAVRYPHQFSGGQRQRVGIARALIMHPKLIIADECISALDVSIQAKIINLLRQLQRELGTAYIFISHDLGVVRHIADRVLVMYLGRVVEQGDSREIFEHPAHPYTQALLASVPRIDGKQGDAEPLTGDVPSPANPPSGCLFHTRCPYCQEICKTTAPELAGEQAHLCACHFAGCLPQKKE